MKFWNKFNKKNAASEPSDAADAMEGQGRVCFVLCKSTKVDIALLESEVEKEFSEKLKIETQDNESFFISVPACGHAFLTLISAPIPDQEAEHNADGNLFWPDAARDLRAYKAHIITGILAGPEDPVQLNMVLSKLARIAIKTFAGVGVYWGDGAVTNSSEVFLDMSEDLDSDTPPLYLWVRFQLVASDDNQLELYTVGMSQFGLNEIEMSPCDWDTAKILDFVYNIVSYLIENGPAINDGDTVGGDERERIIVNHVTGKYIDDEQVYKLTMKYLQE